MTFGIYRTRILSTHELIDSLYYSWHDGLTFELVGGIQRHKGCRGQVHFGHARNMAAVFAAIGG